MPVEICRNLIQYFYMYIYVCKYVYSTAGSFDGTRKTLARHD